MWFLRLIGVSSCTLSKEKKLTSNMLSKKKVRYQGFCGVFLHKWH